MMYFVYRLCTYSAKNKAFKKLLDVIKQYEYILVKDECSLDALASIIEKRIEEINAEHPKLRPICFVRHHSLNRISASVLPISGSPDYVFIMDICNVRGTFQYSENEANGMPHKITAPGICRVCGCTEEDPCYHPDYGTCWWADEEKTLCSHCADKSIADDPQTEHCVNTRRI